LSDELKDGQIYRWRWRENPGADERFSYWCKSQLAIVRGGRLYDTYWSTPSYEHEVDPNKVELTFFADQSWDTITEWEVAYYNDEDVADTRHANSSRAPIYLKPGAVRSEAAILETIQSAEERAAGEIKHSQWLLERMAEARKLVAEGRLNEVRL
jgi:hypothetical protein